MNDVEFKATLFSSPTRKPFGSSQWQISFSADFSTANIFHDSGETQDDGSHIIPFSTLNPPAGTYYWRIRYKTATNIWSAWSVPTSFEILPPVFGEQAALNYSSTSFIDKNGTLWVAGAPNMNSGGGW